MVVALRVNWDEKAGETINLIWLLRYQIDVLSVLVGKVLLRVENTVDFQPEHQIAVSIHQINFKGTVVIGMVIKVYLPV